MYTTLHTVKSLADRHPALSEGGLRWQIFNAKNNGLADSGALNRMGRKILIDEQKFLEWLQSGNLHKQD